MSTVKLHATANWASQPAKESQNTILAKFNAFADRQADSRTLWFMVSLIVQGVFFLPLPAVFMYYFNAPIICLIVTLGLFFANVILGMGGASIRTLISVFALSIVLHLLMLMVFVI